MGHPIGQWRQANTGLQQYPRVAMSVPIRVSTVDPETDPTTGKRFFRSAEETTANLSRGGIYLRSWEPLEAGRRVIVAIRLASGEELQFTGRVVWTRRELRPDPTQNVEAPGYGIEFIGGSSRELGRLDKLIDRLAPETAQPAESETSPPVSTSSAGPATRP